MNCKNCGNVVVPGEQTCRYCGALLEQNTTNQAVNQNYNTNYYNQNNTNNTGYSYQQTSNNTQSNNLNSYYNNYYQNYNNQNTNNSNNNPNQTNYSNYNTTYQNQPTQNNTTTQSNLNSYYNGYQNYNSQNTNSYQSYGTQSYNNQSNNSINTTETNNYNEQTSYDSSTNNVDNNGVSSIPGYTSQVFSKPEKIEDEYKEPKQKSKKKLIMLLGIVIILMALIIIVLSVLNKPKTVTKKTKTNNTKQEENTISYGGFKFKKLDNYNYFIDDDILYITSKDSLELYMSLKVSQVSFDNLKTTYTTLLDKITEKQVSAMDPQIKTISENEFITCIVTEEADTMIYYVSKANDNLIFEGMVVNETKTLSNYEDLNKVAAILKNVSYVGGIDNYSTNYGDNVDLYYNNGD